MFKGTEYYMIVSIKDILSVFLCSMLPIIELRGSIILGAGLDLPWWINAAVSIIGNMLPIPFILIFIRRILHWMAHTKVPFLSKVALWIENKAHKKSCAMPRSAYFYLWRSRCPAQGHGQAHLLPQCLTCVLKNPFLPFSLVYYAPVQL